MQTEEQFNQELGEFFQAPVGDSTPVQPGDAPPVPPQADTPFITTSTGTVYKTKEDAVRGTEQKDATIKNLRERYIAMHGVDPVTGRTVGNGMGTTQPDVSYSQDPERYSKDLLAAVNSGNPADYAKVQKRFVQEAVQEIVGPYGGILTGVAKTTAIAQAKQTGYTDMDTFVGSQRYNEALDKMPLLRNAIEQAESNPQAAGNLEQLYALAYMTSLGMQVPGTLQSVARTASSTTASNPPTARPTLAPSGSPTMPQLSSPNGPDLSTSEGRKAIIENAKSRGLLDVKWDQLRL